MRSLVFFPAKSDDPNPETTLLTTALPSGSKRSWGDGPHSHLLCMSVWFVTHINFCSESSRPRGRSILLSAFTDEETETQITHVTCPSHAENTNDGT